MWALVTGASSGIGLAIAEQLAEEGYSLMLIARRIDRLKAFAAEHPNVEVLPVAADLREPDAPRQILEAAAARQIVPDLLVNNAGFGNYGEFRTLDPAAQTAMVQVNCAAVVALTRLFLPGMIERRSGGILIVASTASFQGVPYQTTYAATKAFDLIFAEGLAKEVKRFGIQVCALCPGQTRTEFHALANEPIPGAMSVHSARDVARMGLKALRAGRHYVIPGFANRFGMQIQRILPRRMVTAVSERLFRPK